MGATADVTEGPLLGALPTALDAALARAARSAGAAADADGPPAGQADASDGGGLRHGDGVVGHEVAAVVPAAGEVPAGPSVQEDHGPTDSGGGQRPTDTGVDGGGRDQSLPEGFQKNGINGSRWFAPGNQVGKGVATGRPRGSKDKVPRSYKEAQRWFYERYGRDFVRAARTVMKMAEAVAQRIQILASGTEPNEDLVLNYLNRYSKMAPAVVALLRIAHEYNLVQPDKAVGQGGGGLQMGFIDQRGQPMDRAAFKRDPLAEKSIMAQRLREEALEAEGEAVVDPAGLSTLQSAMRRMLQAAPAAAPEKSDTDYV